MNTLAKSLFVYALAGAAAAQPPASGSLAQTTPSSAAPFEPCDDGSTPTCPGGAALKEYSFPPCADGKPVCADGTDAKPPPQGPPHHGHHGGWSGSESGSHHGSEYGRGGEHERGGRKGGGRGGFGAMAAVGGASFLAGVFATCLVGRCQSRRKCGCGARRNLATGTLIIQDGAPVTLPSVTSSKFAIMPSGVVVVTKAADGDNKV
jgi:hypothetical protein